MPVFNINNKPMNVPDDISPEEAQDLLNQIDSAGGGLPTSPPQTPSFAPTIKDLPTSLGGPNVPPVNIPETLRSIPSTIAPMIAPTVGAGIGGLVGNAPGALLGGIAGTAANQVLGITPPSFLEFGLNFVGGAAGEAIGGIGSVIKRGIIRRLPGVTASLQKQAVEDAFSNISKLIPLPDQPEDIVKMAIANKILPESNQLSTKQLYDLVEQYNPLIKAKNLLQATDESIAELKLPTAFKNDKLLGKLAKLRAVLMTANDNAIPFKSLRGELPGIGDAVDLTKGKGQEAGILKKLESAIYSDFDEAASSGDPTLTGIKAFRLAQRTVQRTKAGEELNTIVQRAVNEPQKETGLVSIAAGKVVKTLDNLPKNSKFLKSVSPDELRNIRNFYSDMQLIPALPPPPRAVTGSGLAVGRLGVGFALGEFITDNHIMSLLIATEFNRLSKELPVWVAKASTTPQGRQFVLSLLRKTGSFWDHPKMAALGTFIATNFSSGKQSTPNPVRLPSFPEFVNPPPIPMSEDEPLFSSPDNLQER